MLVRIGLTRSRLFVNVGHARQVEVFDVRGRTWRGDFPKKRTRIFLKGPLALLPTRWLNISKKLKDSPGSHIDRM